jgi:hypothetical protein
VKIAIEKAVSCETSISRADYPKAFLSALFFSVGPALIGIILAMIIGEVMLRFWPMEENVHRTVIRTLKYALFALFANGSVWRKFRAKGYTVSQGFSRLTIIYLVVFVLMYVLEIVPTIEN